MFKVVSIGNYIRKSVHYLCDIFMLKQRWEILKDQATFIETKFEKYKFSVGEKILLEILSLTYFLNPEL